MNVDLLNVIKVSRRENGDYYIIDGQNRVLAALKSGGFDLIRCEVHNGLTVREEAEMFSRLNTSRKRVSAHDIFKSGIAAENKDVVFIEGVIKEVGLILVPPKAKNNHEIGVIEPLTEMAKSHKSKEFMGIMQLIGDLSKDGPATRELVVGIRYLADNLTEPLIGGRAETRIRKLGYGKLLERQKKFLRDNAVKNGSRALGLGLLYAMNFGVATDIKFFINPQ